MTTRTAALVAAAGSGTRLGRGPKALVELNGRTLLDLALTALAPHVDELVVAVPADRPTDWPERRGVAYVAGGATRQESVRAMLAATGAEYVLVHDVARPFLTPEVIGRVLTATRTHGAATAVQKMADTVITVSGTELDRTDLRAVQTPQGFRRELLVAAHASAAETGVLATDDAGLVRRLGHKVETVEGSPLLLKLTTQEDLLIAEALMQRYFAQLA